MAGLLSLPGEIITEIYIFAGENLRTPVRLSAVNRRLRAIWLQDSDYIITQSLELTAPGHQDAIALTFKQVSCPMPVSDFHRGKIARYYATLRKYLPGLTRDVPDHPRPSHASPWPVECTESFLLRLQLPWLVRNVEAALEICKGLLDWHGSQTNDEDRRPLTHPIPKLYYTMRQLVIAYHYPEFRRPTCAVLEGLSNGSLATYEMLISYICFFMPNEAVWALKIRDRYAEGQAGDDMPRYKASWDFAFDVYWRRVDNYFDGKADDGYHSFGGRIDDWW